MSIRTSDNDLFWAWTTVVAVGEFIGFGAPALAGAWARDAGGALSMTALVCGGAVEGAVLGWSQARVLGRIFPRFSTPRWVCLTSAAASLAWLIGMSPSTFQDTWSSWSLAPTVVVALCLGVLLLGTIGTAQWLELRRHLDNAAVWIPVTAGAWCVGLVAFSLVAPPLWHEGQPPVAIAAIGLLAGAAMATTMAATSGLALTRMVASRPN